MSQNTEGQNKMLQGRIVWCSGDTPFLGSVITDFNTKQPKLDPKTGEKTVQYGFGLAVPKSEFAQGKMGADFWATMIEEAAKIYPSRQFPPDFAWKYKDGDGVDHNGKPFNQRDGYKDNLVFTLTTQMPIKFFRNDNGVVTQVNEGIRCGDYVQVQVNIKAHGKVGQGKPGLYLNPMAALFIGYGPEIINAPSGEQIFGNAAPTLPPGASATPIGMAPTAAFPTQAMPGAAPTPFAQAPVQQPQAVQPHYGILPQAHQPQPQQAPPQYQMPVPAASPMPYPGAPASYPGMPAPTPQMMPQQQAAMPMPTPMGAAAMAQPGYPQMPTAVPGMPFPQQ